MSEHISLKDHTAFRQRHMHDLGHEVEHEEVFTWRLKNWKSLNKQLTSTEFECGGHKWRILVFPWGNCNAPPYDTVSIYLDSNPNNVPDGWHKCAQFAIALSNPNDPTIYIESHAHHRFTSDEADWGFTRFGQLRDLYSIHEGRTRPIIEDEAVDVTVLVTVMKDPTGILWHNFTNYNSKKHTGYVGIKNQGATDYLCTVLQSFFCLTAFRKAVYQIPVQGGSTTPMTTAFALQSIFYDMQTSDKAVSTMKLTKSFGWRAMDSCMPHDVVEFRKGTVSDSASQSLFMGHMKSYVKGVNIDFEVSRIEEYNATLLDIAGTQNLLESFRRLVAVEILDGDNKYHDSKYGAQVAKKGISFVSFPPVLHINLRRYCYDPTQDKMIKNDDRHEFPPEIDLAEFIDVQSDKSQSWAYTLHEVIVHSGGMSGGHYYTFIKPNPYPHTPWLKFDDDRVTPALHREVFDDNFGGNSETRATSAFVLVYIQTSMMHQVLAPMAPSDIPPTLKSIFEEEHLAEKLLEVEPPAKRQKVVDEVRRERLTQLYKERAVIQDRMEVDRVTLVAVKKLIKEIEQQALEKEKHVTVKVIDNGSFRKHQGFDLATIQSAELATFPVLRTASFSTLKSLVAQHFKTDGGQFHLWTLAHRRNKTIRPDVPVSHDSSITIANICDKRFTELVLYLDIEPLVTASSDSIMIFVKHFDASKQSLLGLDKFVVSRNSRPTDLLHKINVSLQLPSSTQLKFYEEIKPGMVHKLDTRQTFVRSEISNGDIICTQLKLTRQEINGLENQGLCTNPIQFYGQLQRSHSNSNCHSCALILGSAQPCDGRFSCTNMIRTSWY